MEAFGAYGTCVVEHTNLQYGLNFNCQKWLFVPLLCALNGWDMNQLSAAQRYDLLCYINREIVPKQESEIKDYMEFVGRNPLRTLTIGSTLAISRMTGGALKGIITKLEAV